MLWQHAYAMAARVDGHAMRARCHARTHAGIDRTKLLLARIDSIDTCMTLRFVRMHKCT